MLDIGWCGQEELQDWYAHTSITKKELYSFSPYAKSTIRTYLSGVYKSNDINNDKQLLLQAHYNAIIQEEERRKKEEEEKKKKMEVFLQKKSAFNDESDFFLSYCPTEHAYAYILEAVNKDFQPIGIKVGKTENYQTRFRNLKNVGSIVGSRGVYCYRPLAMFPTIGKDKYEQGQVAEIIENVLHIYFHRLKNWEDVANDHFLSNDHFRVWDLLKDSFLRMILVNYSEDFLEVYKKQQDILDIYTKFRYL